VAITLEGRGSSLQQTLAQMHDDLDAGRWHDVIMSGDHWNRQQGEDTRVLQYQAKACANLGRIEQAAGLCERSLELDPMDKHSHLLMGMIRLECSQVDAAETALRRAIYLDTSFLEAHYHLASLLLQQGRHKDGVKQLSNALALAKHSDPDHKVHNAGDMTFGRLAEILESELEMYQQHGG